MAKKATYHNGEGRPDVELFVLSENEDGTLELGNEKGKLLIGKCPTSDKAARREGSCTVVVPEREKKP